LFNDGAAVKDKFEEASAGGRSFKTVAALGGRNVFIGEDETVEAYDDGDVEETGEPYEDD
jgi:hypothetical protein